MLTRPKNDVMALRRLVVIAVIVVFGVLLGASRAEASDKLLVGILDDAQVLGNSDEAFPTLEQLRAQVIRITLRWDLVAASRPGKGNNPDDPVYNWEQYDRAVLAAAARNIEVVFTIWGTPAWANGDKQPARAPKKASHLRAFAMAAARRYSGTFEPERVEYSVLPRVSRWTAWNEPNLSTFLRPQFKRVKKKGKKARFIKRSPTIYARLCNSVVKGIHTGSAEAGFESQVACGVTAPGGTNRGDARRPSISPIPFVRGMKAAGAKFDVYAHHPYPQSRHEKPTDRPKANSRISLGSMWRLLLELERLYGEDMPVWITEYGYQTNPPDEFLGVSPKQQARYLRLAYGIALANPRIEMLIWFLIVDENRPGEPTQGWQSGLKNADGTKKSAYKTFRNLPHP